MNKIVEMHFMLQELRILHSQMENEPARTYNDIRELIWKSREMRSQFSRNLQMFRDEINKPINLN